MENNTAEPQHNEVVKSSRYICYIVNFVIANFVIAVFVMSRFDCIQ